MTTLEMEVNENLQIYSEACVAEQAAIRTRKRAAFNLWVARAAVSIESNSDKAVLVGYDHESTYSKDTYNLRVVCKKDNSVWSGDLHRIYTEVNLNDLLGFLLKEGVDPIKVHLTPVQ